MFDSPDGIARDIVHLLGVIRGLALARYVCLVEPKGVVFEDPAPEDAQDWTLRRLLETRTAALFDIPVGLASGGPQEDLFEGWDDDDFFLAFLNGRVALVAACPDAESLRSQVDSLLRALADRLLRWNPAYRLDPQGRGLFLSAPKLDVVVVARNRG